MDKLIPNSDPLDSERLPEYDFRQGLRGKHYQAYREGHTVNIHHLDGTTTIQHFQLPEGAVMLDPEVREYFPDSETVNQVLRTLIGLIPRKRLGTQTMP